MKYFFCKTLIIGILIFSLSACSVVSNKNINYNEEASKKKTVEKTTLKVWIMPNSVDSERDFMDVVKPFLKENPDITIALTVLNWESAWDKISLSVTSGDAPDITQLGTTWVAAIASTGGLMDLTGKYDENSFIPQTLNTTVQADVNDPIERNKRYAMPWFTETRALYYWKNVCKNAGVDPQKDFKTWDTFKVALRKLNKQNLNGKQIDALGMPSKNDWNVVHNFSWWIWSYGGDFLSADNKKCTINSKNSLMGINAYTDLVKEGLVSKKALETNLSVIQKMFLQGEFATIISIPQPEPLPADVGVTFLPEGPKGRIAFLGGSTLAVYKSSQHQEESLKLLKFLSSKNSQVEYCKKTSFLPVIAEAYDDSYFSQNPNKSVFKEQVEKARAYPSISKWGPLENEFLKGFSSIWDIVLTSDKETNNAKVEKKLEEISKKVDDLLK